MALRPAMHPEMLEARRPMILAGAAEAVEIAFARHAPIFELDAQLEGRLGRAHEIGFVDAQDAVIGDEGWDGAFAYADRADLFAFDQRHLRHRTQRAGERGGGHPAGGAAPGDNDAAREGRLFHCDRLLSRNWCMRAADCASSGASTP